MLVQSRLLAAVPLLRSVFRSRNCRQRSVVSATMDCQPAKVQLALCQFNVSANKEENIQTAKRYVQESAARGAQIVLLPEMWNCPYSNDSFGSYSEDIKNNASKSFSEMKALAKELQIVLIAGSIPEKDGDKVYNSCCIFDADGSHIGTHRKTHLFDIDIPGKVTFKESDTLTAGESLTCVRTRYGTIGIGICYDLRFPELTMAYRERGASLVVFPGAFNMTTGPVHWSLLLRARAVDNQLFVAACSPARDLQASYTAWGHSTIIGPFGEILGELQDEEDILMQTLDMTEVTVRRENMQLETQRRNDLYEFIDKAR